MDTNAVEQLPGDDETAVTAAPVLRSGESDLSRRQVLAGAGGVGILAAAPGLHARSGRSGGQLVPSDGTPEQIHLTWGADPPASMVASWASPGRAGRPRVLSGPRRPDVELRQSSAPAPTASTARPSGPTTLS